MTEPARTIVNVPAQAKRGEVIEIRAVVQHAMESGYRRTELGELIARDIVRSFRCTYNNVEVFRAEFHPAMAANPLVSFTTLATESGTLVFEWQGDHGFCFQADDGIRVS